MPNRLADALSPYLRQHADNPVDWREWSDEAFAEARQRDVPVLLSIGYAACHWCHVMAHESFEDAQVADALNANYVAIKVDREERPDVDTVYMNATMALTGQGGWPMTCLLTPDREPFFAGTYLPKPQFLRLLDAAHQAWTTQRESVLASASHITSELRRITESVAPQPISSDELVSAVSQLRQMYDEARGGFGGAPKFPPSMVLEFLLRHHERTGDRDALAMVTGTCEAMARGGMYDQLAGGFARYSVDADWVVPHFEKMLYDNALLLRVYAHWWRVTNSPLAERVTRETAQFLLSELRTEQGAFAASLDADTEGVEGLTYAWTPDQLADVLGPEDGRRAAELLTVTDEGTFEHGMSTLQLRHDPEDADWWADVRNRLHTARNQRPQPARDDKVVAAWNGLAIAALAEAGTLLDEPAWVEAATACARFLLAVHRTPDGLRRVSRDGAVGDAPAVADDLGDLAEGLLALHQATGQPEFLTAASELLDQAVPYAAPDGGWFDTADGSLVTRPRGSGDNAEPCGTSALAHAQLTLSALTGDPAPRDLADAALASMGRVAARDPRFAGWAMAAAEAAAAGPLQVAVVADTAGTLTKTARHQAPGGTVIVSGPSDSPGIPLLADRPARDGRPTAYVCRGFVCDAPVTDTDALTATLRR
ncbi:thioredoxin domain-containing protein [Calidifontibacter sp. DB0510]|uniref:Thioredoxin domain-containing protein n=1 Tax=Metallococcus carri TaxID=1656884 RepID=A0A967B3H7_9MICO|nr:thioredoxin domain-containing protein [Metallococcus carri]NHN56690.1 thioredoxin domain-containing protein [Metallococcus carri]NOP38989.1 thioredoxin domain-containing protein [Calidifontibacter sp. DB2511S]